MKKAALITLLLLLMFGPANTYAGGDILKVRHWTAPDHTRIVIDTSDEPRYTVEKSERKLTVSFRDAALIKTQPPRLIINKPGIEKITLSSLPDRVVKVELTLSGDVETKVFKLKKFQDKPDRLVIDIALPDVQKQESRSREEIKGQRKDKIIVIDPGHGGDDPGAIGKDGTREKTVVLAISRKLRDMLKKKDGYRAFLTRTGDYYVSFKKRLTIAREYGADLFVSIHADAFRGRSARGSSVYCLSLRGASSEAGRILAGHENLSDIVGGVPDAESSDESGPIVLNMFQTSTINLSKSFGTRVLKHLSDISHIKHGIVQEAPFRVLKLPDIPSVLIETAFISNPGEEQLLRSSRFQTKVAHALMDAIVTFVPASPVEQPKTFITKSNGGKKPSDSSTAAPVKTKPSFYKVRRGDTLAAISKKHDTTLAALLKLNSMKLDDPLYVGRKLKLPPPETDKPAETSKPPKEEKQGPTDRASSHKVKRGDTLGDIARKHDTTVLEMAKLNGLDADAPLFVGRTLKIPAARVATQKGPEDTATQEKNPALEAAPKTFIYKVRKGDTVLIIARRCQTTIGELLELNNIKLTDPLYVDQELIVPQKPLE